MRDTTTEQLARGSGASLGGSSARGGAPQNFFLPSGASGGSSSSASRPAVPVSGWVPFLRQAEICRVLETCAGLRSMVDVPQFWHRVAQAWQCIPEGVSFCSNHVAGLQSVQWRKVCMRHDQLQRAWRGSPVEHRMSLREELCSQQLQDLDVMLVEFLAGDEGFAFGHRKGCVSIWHLVPAEVAGQPPQARVAGVFHTTKRYDVQDMAVSPPAAAQPTALLTGRSIWLAAAVGASAYIWESGEASPNQPAATVLATWNLRATLRHSDHFTAEHHGVWTVRICDGVEPNSCREDASRRAITVSDDGFFRAWSFGGVAGLEGELLWQLHVGDCRQVSIALLGPAGGIVALARADRRSLELFDSRDGVAVETFSDVWPQGAGFMPQTISYDTWSLWALGSSITTSGDGTLAFMDLAGCMPASLPAGVTKELPAEKKPSQCTHQLEGPLAGLGRVLALAVAVPAAGVLLAVVQQDHGKVVLEVWDRAAVLEGCGLQSPFFRGRVPTLMGNRRLVAAGGRRLFLLDPSAVKSRGEIRLFEWRSRPPPRPSSPRAASAVSTASFASNPAVSWSGSAGGGTELAPHYHHPRRDAEEDEKERSSSGGHCSCLSSVFRRFLGFRRTALRGSIEDREAALELGPATEEPLLGES